LGAMQPSFLPPVALVNIYFECKKVFVNDLSAGIGVYNVMGTNFLVPQAYKGIVPPIPSQTRELVCKVGYQF
jgi:outer membrane receptor for ferrienterochelin and colicins